MMYRRDATLRLYEHLAELEEKLQKSEEDRKTLEVKFQYLSRVGKIEEEQRLQQLHERYAEFLKYCKERNDRNERILRSVERVENGANAVFAKTERLKQLRTHYNSYISRMIPLWRNLSAIQYSDNSQILCRPRSRGTAIVTPSSNVYSVPPHDVLEDNCAFHSPNGNDRIRKIGYGPIYVIPESQIDRLEINRASVPLTSSPLNLGEAGKQMLRELDRGIIRLKEHLKSSENECYFPGKITRSDLSMGPNQFSPDSELLRLKEQMESTYQSKHYNDRELVRLKEYLNISGYQNQLKEKEISPLNVENRSHINNSSLHPLNKLEVRQERDQLYPDIEIARLKEHVDYSNPNPYYTRNSGADFKYSPYRQKDVTANKPFKSNLTENNSRPLEHDIVPNNTIYCGTNRLNSNNKQYWEPPTQASMPTSDLIRQPMIPKNEVEEFQLPVPPHHMYNKCESKEVLQEERQFEIECLAADEEEDQNLSDDEVLDSRMMRPRSDIYQTSRDVEYQQSNLTYGRPQQFNERNQNQVIDREKVKENSGALEHISKKSVVAHKKSVEELKAMLSVDDDNEASELSMPQNVYGDQHEDEDIPEEFTESDNHYDPRYDRDVSRNVILEEDEPDDIEEEKQTQSNWRKVNFAREQLTVKQNNALNGRISRDEDSERSVYQQPLEGKFIEQNLSERRKREVEEIKRYTPPKQNSFPEYEAKRDEIKDEVILPRRSEPYSPQTQSKEIPSCSPSIEPQIVSSEIYEEESASIEDKIHDSGRKSGNEPILERRLEASQRQSLGSIVDTEENQPNINNAPLRENQPFAEPVEDFPLESAHIDYGEGNYPNGPFNAQQGNYPTWQQPSQDNHRYQEELEYNPGYQDERYLQQEGFPSNEGEGYIEQQQYPSEGNFDISQDQYQQNAYHEYPPNGENLQHQQPFPGEFLDHHDGNLLPGEIYPEDKSGGFEEYRDEQPYMEELPHENQSDHRYDANSEYYQENSNNMNQQYAGQYDNYQQGEQYQGDFGGHGTNEFTYKQDNADAQGYDEAPKELEVEGVHHVQYGEHYIEKGQREQLESQFDKKDHHSEFEVERDFDSRQDLGVIETLPENLDMNEVSTKPSVMAQLMESESESYQVSGEPAPDDSDFDFSIGKQ